MNIDDAFPSKLLKAAELDGDVTYTIKDVKMEQVGGDDEPAKPVVYFEEIRQGFALNSTNRNTIKELYGKMTEDWVGERITLFPTEVDFAGKQVLAIRIRMRKPGGSSAAAPASAARTENKDPKATCWNAFCGKVNEYNKSNPDDAWDKAKIQQKFKELVADVFPDKDPAKLNAIEWGKVLEVVDVYSPVMGEPLPF